MGSQNKESIIMPDGSSVPAESAAIIIEETKTQGGRTLYRRFFKAVVCMLLAMLMVVAPLEASAASKTVKILKVNSDYVRMRSEPEAGDNVKAKLRKNSKVFYLGESKKAKGWYKVRTDHGSIGWVYKDFLSSYGAAKLSSIYVAKSSKLYVYKRASNKSTRLTVLSKNQHVIVHSTSGSWAYIQTLSGTNGYVLKSGLKKAS